VPVTYSFREHVLEVQAVGNYAPVEVEQAFRAALADPNRPMLRAALYDVRASNEIAARTTPEVREAVAFFESLSEKVGRRVALLATSDVGYGVMRMVAAWAEARNLEAAVFRDANEAFAWASR